MAEQLTELAERPPRRRPPLKVAAVRPGIVAQLAYVRGEEEPILPPPPGNIGFLGWLSENLFASVSGAILTFIGIVFIAWVVPPIVNWAFIDAVWTGNGREACIVPGAGACWAFVDAKFGQFIYGRYPIDERWRVNLTAILLVIGLVPIAIPRVPYKRATAIYLFGIFPVVALLLLTGGHFDISTWVLPSLVLVGCFATAIVATVASHGASPIYRSVVAPAAAGVALLAFLASFFFDQPTVEIAGSQAAITTVAIAVCGIVGLVAGLVAIVGAPGRPGGRTIFGVWIALAVVAFLVTLFSIDFGLPYVETPRWGGLLVTLVVALTGMGASMPLGVSLALGRRSKLPVVRFVSVGFIEFVRGVPLITVLFMASVMLPFFLPEGVNFDKLLRALIGVALFEAAYMAEVVRGGLQAIPSGQYEAAQAVGLNYWQSMRLVILPQALKIVIPGIVNSFISLFKDTSLVGIIGIFDLLSIVGANFTDANWASPSTPATGYVFAAAVFWMFCFGMSRYSIYTERRLDTGYRR